MVRQAACAAAAAGSSREAAPRTRAPGFRGRAADTAPASRGPAPVSGRGRPPARYRIPLGDEVAEAGPLGPASGPAPAATPSMAEGLTLDPRGNIAVSSGAASADSHAYPFEKIAAARPPEA